MKSALTTRLMVTWTTRVDRVIVDPGDKKFEAGNPGLLYMAVSRATTLGESTTSSSATTSPPNLNSAIYFTGHNMTLHRVTNLKLKKNGEEYEKVQLRNKWVARVKANTMGMKLAPGDTQETVLDWCKKFRMRQEELEQAIANPTWRKNLNRDLNY